MSLLKTRKGKALLVAFWVYTGWILLTQVIQHYLKLDASGYGMLVGVGGLALIAWLGHWANPTSFKEPDKNP